jgi:heat shock protein HtpX
MDKRFEMRGTFINTFKTFVLRLPGCPVHRHRRLFGTGGLIIGAVLALVFVGGTFWFSDKIAVAAARAKPVSREEAPRLYEIVEELARRNEMPTPRLYVSPEPQPNAFATGRGPKHAVVAVTQGILQVLDDDELRGVLAHEMSHVRNRDILIGSVAAAVALMITFVARIAMFSAIFGGGDDEGGGNIIGLLALAILAPLAAGLLQAALSRSREYQADESGAHLIGEASPWRALQKIGRRRADTDEREPAEATAYIINPLTGRKVNFASLFSTHPPTGAHARLRGLDHHAPTPDPRSTRTADGRLCPPQSRPFTSDQRCRPVRASVRRAGGAVLRAALAPQSRKFVNWRMSKSVSRSRDRGLEIVPLLATLELLALHLMGTPLRPSP